MPKPPGRLVGRSRRGPAAPVVATGRPRGKYDEPRVPEFPDGRSPGHAAAGACRGRAGDIVPVARLHRGRARLALFAVARRGAYRRRRHLGAGGVRRIRWPERLRRHALRRHEGAPGADVRRAGGAAPGRRPQASRLAAGDGTRRRHGLGRARTARRQRRRGRLLRGAPASRRLPWCPATTRASSPHDGCGSRCGRATIAD